MVRLILLIIIILFVIWILRPFLKSKDSKRNRNTVDRVLHSDQNNFRHQNTILIIIAAVISLAIVVWLLPKFGINFFALFQKIIPIISFLRGILPF